MTKSLFTATKEVLDRIAKLKNSRFKSKNSIASELFVVQDTQYGLHGFMISTLEAKSSALSQISVGPEFCLFGCGLEGFWFKLWLQIKMGNWDGSCSSGR